MADNYLETPLWNTALKIEERLDYLIQAMTLDEKIACLTTGCPNIPRLGVKAFSMGGEAAHGIEARHDQAFNAGEPEFTTSFTQPIGMSASFDRELIKECGRAVGEEARALYKRNGGGGLCRWAPTVDMERDPRWGRTEESYGEDPFLTGEMASAYSQGMHGDDPFYIRCGATLKHFYANNVEENRVSTSSSLTRRNKQEYYWEPFRKVIMEGKAEAVMTSYNEINGIPAIVNEEVQKLIKDIWGLPGHVVCDGGDMQQTVDFHHFYQTHAETVGYGLKAGIDCFTDDKAVVEAAAREALSMGIITEKEINQSIRNSFRTRIRLGLYDNGKCPYDKIGEESINNEEHRNLALKMAEEAIVLLKNEDELLPFDKEKTESLAVVGPLADVWYKDWYSGIPPYHVTPLEGIKREYQGTVAYADGKKDIYLRVEGQYVGLDAEKRLKLTDKQHAQLFTWTDWGFGSNTLVAKETGNYVTLREGSYLIQANQKEAFSWFIRESWNFIRQEKEEYLLSSWNKRLVTVDEEGYLVVIKTDEVMVGEGDDAKLKLQSYAVKDKEPVSFTIEVIRDGIEEAVELARTSQKAVVILGTNPVINSKEEIDRTSLALPPVQQELAERIYQVNPNTVVVLITNYPHTIQKLKEMIPAILLSASGSQELGNAIAHTLFGKAVPAGRLNMTWYLSEKDLPDKNQYDIIHAGSTYQYMERQVLYPFGYGLSYSNFVYDAFKIKEAAGQIECSLTISNKGKYTADEVVQIYVHKEKSRVKQPIKQLLGFAREKNIEPGETRNVFFTIPITALRYYDVISQELILESSNYVFMAGSSSEDIRAKAVLNIEGDKAACRNPYKVTPAECFDEYEHIYLHRGNREYACVVTGEPGEEPNEPIKGKKQEALLEYRDFFFTDGAASLSLNVHALENSSITIYLEDIEIGALQLEAKLGFDDYVIFIPEEKVPIEKRTDMKIKIEGKTKISDFYYLPVNK